MSRWLAAIPVYNEVNHVHGVLDEVVRYAPDVLAVDDTTFTIGDFAFIKALVEDI